MSTTPENGFSEDRHGIVYREGVSLLASVIFGCFGLVFLAVAVAFLVEVVSWPWHGGKVAGLLTVLVFVCFSVAVLLLAIAVVRPQHLQFDAGTRRVKGRVRGRLWLLRSIDAGFDTLQDPVITSTSREMDSDLYEIRVGWVGHQPLALGPYERRADAEYWRGRLAGVLKK